MRQFYQTPAEASVWIDALAVMDGAKTPIVTYQLRPFPPWRISQFIEDSVALPCWTRQPSTWGASLPVYNKWLIKRGKPSTNAPFVLNVAALDCQEILLPIRCGLRVLSDHR